MKTSEIEPGTPTLDHRLAGAFGLRGERWMRHANPISVWARFSVVSLVALAIWSREWIGWACLVPLAAVLVWMVVNPLLFGVPSSTRNWASKAVLGERVWAERTSLGIPPQFRSRVPRLANVVSCLGVLVLARGLVVQDVWTVVAGIVITHLAKLWYLDRMVLLFDDVKGRNAEVASWELGP
jgi:hypothetical protein